MMWRWIVLILLLGMNSVVAVSLHPGQERFNPLPAASWAFDAEQGWQPEQAWDAYRGGDFSPARQHTLNLGGVSRPVWLAFEVTFAEESPPGRWFFSLDSPLFEQVELYYLQAEGWYRLPPGQIIEPLSGRLQNSPRPLFALPVEAGAAHAYLLRLSGAEAMLIAPRILTDRALLASERQRSLWLGLYFGVILALGLYNAMLWLVLRDRSYFWYTLFIAATAVFFVLMNQLLSAWWPDLSLRVWSFLVTLTKMFLGLGLLLFTRHFMLTVQRDQVMDRLIRYGIWLAPSIPLFNLLAGPQLSVVFSALLGMYTGVVIITTAWRALRRGFTPALLVIPAWLVLFGSLAIFVSMYLGWLPYNWWTAHAFMLGSATEAILLALALGYRIRSLEAERDNLSQRGKHLLTLSLTDPLTGLFNKRHLTSALKEAVSRSHAQGEPLSLVMIDADHFKAWNDTWGHQAGDEVLHSLGEQIRYHTRDSDIPCRYGGEEFCIILPGTDRDAAARIAERLRGAVEQMRFSPQAEASAGLTVSIGVAQMAPGDDMYSLISRSDRALYQAKQQGRNRCVVSAPEAEG